MVMDSEMFALSSIYITFLQIFLYEFNCQQ